MVDITPMEGTVQRTHILRKIHLDARDRAMRGYYVVSGGVVSQRAAGANMSVDVAAISYMLAGVPGSASLTNVVISAADPANPRVDVLYINGSGVMTVAAGTPASIVPVGEGTWQKWETPYPVDMYGTEGIILAEIRVPAAATSIVDADIRMLGSKLAFQPVSEEPSGDKNGVNKSFALAYTPFGSTILLLLNGQVLVSGASDDYTLSGVTITLTAGMTAPNNTIGDKLRAFYFKLN